MHRRRLATVILLALAAVQIVPNALLSAGERTQNVIAKHSVLASDSVLDASGCVTTSVWVSADTSTGIAPPAPSSSPPGAQVALTRVDTCAKRTLLAASGSVAFEGGELEVKGNPKNARLLVVIPATDVATGSAFEVRVDLAWQGVGPVEHSIGSPAPPAADAPRIRIRYRQATVSGTVSDGTTDFRPSPDATASITTAIARPSGAGSRLRDAGAPAVGFEGTPSARPVLSAPPDRFFNPGRSANASAVHKR